MSTLLEKRNKKEILESQIYNNRNIKTVKQEYFRSMTIIN